MAHTRESIRRLVSDSTTVFVNGVEMSRGDYAAMRAVCRLYACQLAHEKARGVTTEDNDIGFNQSHAKIGKYLAEWMDCGRGDGVWRRPTQGKVNKFIFDGYKPNGKKNWIRFSSEFVGRDRREICRYLAGFYAQQLADFANGDKRNTARKVA